MLREQRAVPFATLLERLEVSRATLKRDLEYMRSRLHAPIVYDRNAGGYTLGSAQAPEARFELPGLWFSPAEIHALLTLQHLVSHLRTGSLIGPHIEALTQRLSAVLGSAAASVEEVRRRVRILDIGARGIALEHFERVGSALLARRRLHIAYFARGRGESSEREVSPQRLVHYRDNWYLDAFCHLRNDLRSFAVDAIRSADILESAALDVADAELDARLGGGYGIFSGAALDWARLRFSPIRARWVANEQWHPQQRTRFESGGAFILEVPYSDSRELVMDILRHGTDVEVLAPRALREEIARTVAAMHTRYQDPDAT